MLDGSFTGNAQDSGFSQDLHDMLAIPLLFLLIVDNTDHWQSLNQDLNRA